MDHWRVGGLLEARKIAGMAEVRHVQVAPRHYCGVVAGAAKVQFATCSPNLLIQESIEDRGGLHSAVLKKGMPFEQGRVIPPIVPGHGIELDEVVSAEHSYTGHMLQFDMGQHPVCQ